MTINELLRLCERAKENGLGDRIVTLYDYKLGNSHKMLQGRLKAMEDCNTTIPRKLNKYYIELS